jgi:hypothetical protein
MYGFSLRRFNLEEVLICETVIRGQTNVEEITIVDR